jgi:diadenylate cyclase
VLTSVIGPLFEIRPTDVVDILFVTAVVAAAITWIRRTRAALVATGIVILGAVYLVAQALNLQLTTWILQGFFAIFVVIIVVIFQEELRQLFERLAVWGLRRAGSTPAGNVDPMDVVVKCFADFARDRVGALVVVPGRQPIERHVSGGVECGGKCSLPLLKSIFDPHSPGHDGAVILENGTIARFAVHLPLSKDLAQLAGVGTRHSAALGLAELTDALCLVASEERGRISVAQRSTLRELPSPQALGPILQQFLEAQRPPAPRHGAQLALLRENWLEAAVALVLVMALWYVLVPGSRPKEARYAVPVTVTNLPPQYRLESVTPDKVDVTLRGLARAFYLFNASELEVTIDASLAKFGRRTFQLLDDNVRHPSDLDVEVDPPEVKISLEKLSEKPPGAS